MEGRKKRVSAVSKRAVPAKHHARTGGGCEGVGGEEVWRVWRYSAVCQFSMLYVFSVCSDVIYVPKGHHISVDKKSREICSAFSSSSSIACERVPSRVVQVSSIKHYNSKCTVGQLWHR